MPKTLPPSSSMAQTGVPGPEGALSTIHFENYRDGLEDHAYLVMLRGLVAEAKSEGKNFKHAENLLSIPTKIFQGFSPDPQPKAVGCSEDPGMLRAHREMVARAIESLSHGVAVS